MDGFDGERQIGHRLEDIEPKHVERYEFAAAYCAGKTVLDAACGVGYGSSVLAKVADKVVGIDRSREAIEYAQKFWWGDNIVFRQFDLSRHLRKLGTFDVIVSLETIEHLPTPMPDTIRKFSAVLPQGGLLVISHPENEQAPTSRKPRPERSELSFRRKLAKAMRLARAGRFRELAAKTGRSVLERDRARSNSSGSGGFHLHFEIKGDAVLAMLNDAGFAIERDWYQDGRFHYRYHLVVGRKK